MATPRGHPGTLKKGTAYSIVNQLEEDADRIEAALPAEDRDPDAETGPSPPQMRARSHQIDLPQESLASGADVDGQPDEPAEEKSNVGPPEES